VFCNTTNCETVALPAESVAALHPDRGAALERRYAKTLFDA
jgi:hypothetical protein